jgi:O-antigen chain-terminating methyltransferase
VGDDELTAAIQAIRDRVRARHPEGSLGLEGVVAPDLTQLLHARDAAEAKVAAIGTVNPRKPGPLSSIVQFFKRTIARALDWHVREQVEFNRASMRCVQASLEALNGVNRALAALAAHHQEHVRYASVEIEELKDIRRHWAEWRVGFEDRRSASEIHMLRTIAELQGAFQHRVTLVEQNFREMVRQQHTGFESALARNITDVQKQLWRDLEQIRGEYEKLIHAELRLIRQKAVAETAAHSTASGAPLAAAPNAPLKIVPIHIDWLRFAEVFRGSPERIRDQQTRYAAKFAAASPPSGGILDVGCGRGEFLEVARDAGLEARGIDQSEECVAICKSKGLAAERADLFQYLDSLPDLSLGGMYCSQVVEHLPPDRLPDLVNLLARKLNRGAMVAIETPNPECLAIFASHFYIDPTHTRPVPAPLLRFYLEEAGLVNIEVERLAPAVDSWPSLMELPTAVRENFFGGLDYAIFARKL